MGQIIQYLPIFITALLGIFGLISKTKKDDKPGLFNKLTPFGIVVLILLVASLIIAVLLQINKKHEDEHQKKDARNKQIIDSLKERHKYQVDSIRYRSTIDTLKAQKKLNLKQIQNDSVHFNVALANFSKELKFQSKTLFAFKKIFHPIKDISLFYEIEVSGKSEQLREYLVRLKKAIDSLPADKVKSMHGINGVKIVGTQNGIPYLYEIDSTSTLYPINTKNEMDIYSLIRISPDLEFFKTPVNVEQTSMYVQSNNMKTDLKLKHNNIFVSMIDPIIDHQPAIRYNYFKDVLILRLYVKMDPNWRTDESISSIPDLQNAELYINFDFIEPDINIKPNIFAVNIGDLHFNTQNEVKLYRSKKKILFKYEFSKLIKQLLQIWQE